MSIELPKDAEGREIPLDTVVLFGGNDNAYNITGWIYVTDFDLSNSMAGQWRALTDKFTRLDPELMYLTPSDSWEKLLEDLGEAGDARYYEACAYFHRDKDEDGRRGHGGARRGAGPALLPRKVAREHEPVPCGLLLQGLGERTRMSHRA